MKVRQYDMTAIYFGVLAILVGTILLAHCVRQADTPTVYTPAVVLDTAEIRIEDEP